MRLVVICPHFAPDTAPTGAVISRIVAELAERGHEFHVVTSLPWYRAHAVEPEWRGKLVRTEDTTWGRITRIHPFASANKRDLFRRGAAFVAFTAVATAVATASRGADAVFAMSPPLTIGPAGWLAARTRRRPLVFNVQDVYPDIAVAVGALRNRRLIRLASRVERMSYDGADAVTVLSSDLRQNVAAKTRDPAKVRVIPNFVDTDAIRPAPNENSYRREFGLTGKTVVMYAGNVGFSQPLSIFVEAARRLRHRDEVVFVVNGAGSGLDDVKSAAAGLTNIVFVPLQPDERVSEVLAAADIHTVLLRRGLAQSSVPSKTYSILASGRPLVASVDGGTEVSTLIDDAKAGIAVPPDDADSFVAAVGELIDDQVRRVEMGKAAREHVAQWMSPAAVAAAYEDLFAELVSKRRS